ncbi:MAG: phytanoyl-CoA dioxygenase family protein [Microthrixaceae bacterium]
MRVAPPHELNDNFEWEPAPGRSLVSHEESKQWDDQGFFCLEGAIDPQLIARVTDEIDPLEAQLEELLRAAGGTVSIATADEITFTTHVVTRSPVLRDFASGFPFTALCCDLIGPDARLYWDQAVYKKPEPGREFPWHQDNGYTFIEPQQYMTCWVPLVDATVDNGCPWVLPGVHRRGTLEHWSTDLGFECVEHAEGAVPVEARVGDVVVLSSLTPHRTGPNTSDDVRKAYILQYAPDAAVVKQPDAFASTGLQNDPDRQFVVLQGGEPVEGSQ